MRHRLGGRKLVAAGHAPRCGRSTAEDRAAFVGEAAGVWLWADAWPGTAAAVLLEQFELRDACDPGNVFELPLRRALATLAPPPSQRRCRPPPLG